MWRLNAYNYKKDETKFQMTPTITWITAVHVTRDCPLCDVCDSDSCPALRRTFREHHDPRYCRSSLAVASETCMIQILGESRPSLYAYIAYSPRIAFDIYIKRLVLPVRSQILYFSNHTE